MKKLLGIAFCIVYLMSSIGVSLNFHYCGGKIKAVSLFHWDEKDCCGKEMKKPGCCKEKTVSYKVKADQNLCAKALCAKVLTEVTQAIVTTTFVFKKDLCSNNNWPSDDPPDRPGNPRFLVNRTFRI